jgi:Ni/Co efflux regulator RcnB
MEADLDRTLNVTAQKEPIMQRFFSTLTKAMTRGVMVTALLGVPLAAQAKQPEHAANKSEDHGNKHDKGHGDDRGDSHHSDKGKKDDHDHRGDEDDKSWRSDERSAIESFFTSHWADGTPRGKSLPPGLAKQGKIPPGIAAQIQQGKRLPEGVGRALPSGLNALLPQRTGVQSLLVGDDVVLVDAVSQVIVDVLRGVAR